MNGSSNVCYSSVFIIHISLERDEDFTDPCSQFAYLDLKTGKVIWVFEEDDARMYAGIDPEENEALRNQIDAHSKRYLEIPGRDHSEHYEVLRDFLESHSTDDEELWKQARNAYSGSIGGWKEEVDNHDVVHDFYAFRDRKIKEIAQDLFRDNDI